MYENVCKFNRLTRESYFPWNPLRLKYEMFDFLKRPDIEGVKNYFYLDSEGKITVGVGEMIPNNAIGEKIFDGFHQYLYSDVDCKIHATPKQVDELWDELGKLMDENEGIYKKNSPRYYLKKEGDKALYMDKNKIEALAMDSIQKKISDMVRAFPNIKNSPLPAQKGVLDVFYNVGAGRVHSKFHEFSKAVREYKWLIAGHHAHRKNINEDRNVAVMGLFMQAEQEEYHYRIHEAFVNGPRVCASSYAEPSPEDMLFHGVKWPQVCEKY